ncbi:hypothetical protein GCM10009409_37490 [Shewanella saliphila]|uniref:Uncharacterized protein n=1 Tax=Shewanella saliphila TaxID=2282698 RepID=A0ABQ2QCN3_9GAMM|nr:hypothetical protein GCM10009409_37490 [Shewanella saliphila]
MPLADAAVTVAAITILAPIDKMSCFIMGTLHYFYVNNFNSQTRSKLGDILSKTCLFVSMFDFDG